MGDGREESVFDTRMEKVGCWYGNVDLLVFECRRYECLIEGQGRG